MGRGEGVGVAARWLAGASDGPRVGARVRTTGGGWVGSDGVTAEASGFAQLTADAREAKAGARGSHN